MSLISKVYQAVPMIGGQTSDPPVQVKLEKPKNFTRKKTHGMNRRQFKAFKRMLRVNARRNSQ